MLDAVAWADAEQLVRELVDHDRRALRRAPPRSTTSAASRRWSTSTCSTASARRAPSSRSLGAHGHVATAQSLGGEDFGWYLDRVPGAMARLGTRTPGGPTYDLHQGNLRIDESAIAIGARVLADAALVGRLAGLSGYCDL